MHGCQPDAFVVCHEPTRTHMRNVRHPIPDISEVIDLTVATGRLTNSDIRCVGLALNTEALGEDEARAYIAETSAKYDLPAGDPMRDGVDPIVDRIVAEFHA